MAGKKSTKKAATKPVAEKTEGTGMGVSGKLKKAVWHSGRMYDPKKKGDAEAFAKVIANEKNGAAMAERLASKGVITGFGTKGGKGKKGENTAPAGASEPDDALGGGLGGHEADEELSEEEAE